VNTFSREGFAFSEKVNASPARANNFSSKVNPR
jgi:hypothetical protein